MRASRKPARKIPVATAILALVLCTVILFGGAAIIYARVTATDDDVGLHIDGVWATEEPTHNDELIFYYFAGNEFTALTESTIFNASPEIIENIREYHVSYFGASLDAEYVGDGTFYLRVTAEGTFALDGDGILLVTGEGITRRLPFYWEGETILIDGYRFVRR